jgi:DNA-binding NtrC family response regulator
MQTLLVIDDDPTSCRLVQAIFAHEGMRIVVAHNGRDGLDQATTVNPNVVLLDLRLGEDDGLEILAMLHKARSGVPVIMFTASQSVKPAVQAIQLGAFDYLTKPIDTDDLVVTVKRALENQALKQEVAHLRRHVVEEEAGNLAALMGRGDSIARVIEQVQTVATSDFTVLVIGETGTGKELVAQAVHRLSARNGRPFVALDCGAIPEPLLESELFGHEKGAFTGADRRKTGRLRLAERGTCLLDEVGNLPITLQAKLLRVLESRQVQPVGAEHTTRMDVRFVAATNDDLQERVSQGRFRADLYFRLAQYTIALPPLRHRREDIPYLAQRFLEEASVELRRPIEVIVPAALDELVAYDWPGNVRELRNVIRQAVLHTSTLAVQTKTIHAIIGTTAQQPPPAGGLTGQSLREVADVAARAAERRTICETLTATGGNKSEAARILRTDYKTLHVKMKQLGVRAQDFSSR